MMRWRPNASVLISIGVHAVVVAAILPLVVPPRDLGWMLSPRVTARGPSEQIRFVSIPPSLRDSTATATRAPASEQIKSRSGQSGPPRPTLVAHEAMDNGVPVPTTDLGVGASTAQPGFGGAGTGGRVSLIPGTDRRLWTALADDPTATPHAERLERALSLSIKAGRDSIAALGRSPPGPPAWVSDRAGIKLGVDKDLIYVGKLSVPSLLLGLIPVTGFGCYPFATVDTTGRLRRNVPGTVCMQQENPNIADRARRISEMGAEIRERATLAGETRDEVARIAARAERERARRIAEQPSATAAGPAGSGPPPPAP